MKKTDAPLLETRLRALDDRSDGLLGVCVLDEKAPAQCVNGNTRFSLQSVMKLIVGAAAMEAADQGRLNLDEEVVLRQADLSLHVQPLARIVAQNGHFRTTLGDLVERAVIESDSAATDYLFARLGGVEAIQAFLHRNQVADRIRIDRDERHLQTEVSGVEWRAEFVRPEALEAARGALSHDQKRAAFQAYLSDERDTATPFGMAIFLRRLADGHMLSAPSTERFLAVMRRTRTFPTRLRAGVPADWSVAHKTGTSADFDGMNAVSNDVGLFFTPDGDSLAVAVFLARSRQSSSQRDAVIADTARTITDAYGR